MALAQAGRWRACLDRGAWCALKKALNALGSPDRDRLDLHSFRRAGVTSAHQAGIPLATAMRMFNHQKADVHLGRQRSGAFGPEVRASLMALKAQRKAAWQRLVEQGRIEVEQSEEPLPESGLDQGWESPIREGYPPQAASSLCSR